MKIIIIIITSLVMVSISQAQLGKTLGKVANSKNVKSAKELTQAVSISDEEVMAISKEAVDWMDENNPVADPVNDERGARLEKLVKNHWQEDGMNLNFKVYNVIDVNAFATADGSVRVMAGLMDILSDDELLGVIGHEIGHVKNKHTKNQMKKAYTVAIASDVAANNTGAGRVLKDSDLSKLMENFANAQFSQSDESESDEYAFAFMVKHGYDYHALESAFNKLAELSGSDGKGSMMSSHPGSAKRAKRAAEWSAKQDSKK